MSKYALTLNDVILTRIFVFGKFAPSACLIPIATGVYTISYMISFRYHAKKMCHQLQINQRLIRFYNVPSVTLKNDNNVVIITEIQFNYENGHFHVLYCYNWQQIQSDTYITERRWEWPSSLCIERCWSRMAKSMIL